MPAGTVQVRVVLVAEQIARTTDGSFIPKKAMCPKKDGRQRFSRTKGRGYSRAGR